MRFVTEITKPTASTVDFDSGISEAVKKKMDVVNESVSN